MKKYNLQKQLHQLALLSGCLLTLSSVWAAEHPPRVATPEGKAPGDAIVVFDGEGKEALVNGQGKDLGWPVENGELVVKSKPGAFTKHHFSDAQIHVEFACPNDRKEGGGAGNSGLYIHGLYELQIYNSYDHQIESKGMLGAIYGQYSPPVNVARPTGQWQVYDIIFHAPRRDAAGQVSKPGRITAFLNGVLLHDNVEITTPTASAPLQFRPTPYTKELHAGIRATGSGPLFLQGRASPVRYRNIWIRDLKKNDSTSGK